MSNNQIKLKVNKKPIISGLPVGNLIAQQMIKSYCANYDYEIHMLVDNKRQSICVNDNNDPPQTQSLSQDGPLTAYRDPYQTSSTSTSSNHSLNTTSTITTS